MDVDVCTDVDIGVGTGVDVCVCVDIGVGTGVDVCVCVDIGVGTGVDVCVDMASPGFGRTRARERGARTG
ncbi:hypothetical protein [Streptomyces anulatus]|uniref:hypothetical protein n=1 Tax=Streptomyces anulatus TaxID=1892 RepID=UPI00371A63C5